MENIEDNSLQTSLNSLIVLKELGDHKLLTKHAEYFRKLFFNHFTEDSQNNNIKFTYNELINNPSTVLDKQPVQFSIYQNRVRDKKSNSISESQIYSYHKSFYKQKKILGNLVKSKKFEYLLIGLLILDSISKAIIVNKTELNQMQMYSLKSIQLLYVLTFVIEVLLKIFADFSAFCKSPWNTFDLINLLLTILLEIIHTIVGFSHKNNNVVKFLDLLGVFRIFTNIKILSHFIELRIIVICLTKAVRSVVLISILLFIFTFIFSNMGFTLFDKKTVENSENSSDYFTSIFESSITLFAIMTLDQWWKILTNTESSSSFTKTLYFISWVLLASFIFQNLFTGVMVNNFQEIREEVVKNLDLKRIKQAQKESFKQEDDINRQRLLEDKSNNLDENDKIRIKNQDWCRLIEESGEMLKNLENKTIWPEDTLIRYYELMQVLMDNLKERIDLVDLANESLISMHDRDHLNKKIFKFF
ncbi:cation channel sperm-associated 2 [Brachionus plicatilis]|uniref:Cation channel sperm-associated 2 n=1 Tax=Brachionus plicatilis TaxID=10195 RepID=A0A3M7QAU4_BRAPC|nr:cation channel sperm-associated 2 [Brachionus plicatilis]